MNMCRRALGALGFSLLLAGCGGGTLGVQPSSSPIATARAALTSVSSSVPGTSGVETTAPETPVPQTPAPETPTTPPTPGDHGVSDRLVAYNWKDRIEVMSADGSGAHELLPDVPGSQDPIAWSADGSRLLYASQRGVALVDVAGQAQEERELPCPIQAGSDPVLASCRVDPDGGLALSPDGTQVAYTVLDGSHDQANRVVTSALVVLDLGSGLATRLESTRVADPVKECDAISIDRTFNHHPSWSPDGTRLVFAREAATCPGSVFTVNVDGTDLRELMRRNDLSGRPDLVTENGKPITVLPRPVWSPDGSRILVAAGGDIYTVRPDGSGLTALTGEGAATWPSWTRDGRIAFTRWDPSRDRRGDDWVIDADGANATRLEATIPALTAAGCLVCAYPVYHDASGAVVDPLTVRQAPPLEMLSTTTMLWQP